MEEIITTDDMLANDVDISYDMPLDGAMNDMAMNDMVMNDMAMNDMGNSESKGLSNSVILGIVIAVCVVVGIVLGIIVGKRAANK